MTTFLFIILQLVQSWQPQSNWQAIETTKFDWSKSTQTLILEKRNEEEFRLRIQTPGQVDFLLPITNGILRLNDEILDKQLLADNLLSSSYLYISPLLRDRSGRPMLLVFGEPRGSDPGGLNVVALGQTRVPIVVFSSEAFQLSAIKDLDGDNRSEIVGLHCLSQEWGTCFSTYDPYSVYRFSYRSGKAALSVALSKAYNLKNYYGWAGPSCSELIAVVRCAPKGKARLMRAARAKRLYGK